MPKCSKCQEEKDDTEFHLNRSRYRDRDGLKTRCKVCESKKAKEYFQHPEVKERRREYNQLPEVKERKREYNKKYRQKKKELLTQNK